MAPRAHRPVSLKSRQSPVFSRRGLWALKTGAILAFVPLLGLRRTDHSESFKGTRMNTSLASSSRSFILHPLLLRSSFGIGKIVPSFPRSHAPFSSRCSAMRLRYRRRRPSHCMEGTTRDSIACRLLTSVHPSPSAMRARGELDRDTHPATFRIWKVRAYFRIFSRNREPAMAALARSQLLFSATFSQRSSLGSRNTEKADAIVFHSSVLLAPSSRCRIVDHGASGHALRQGA